MRTAGGETVAIAVRAAARAAVQWKCRSRRQRPGRSVCSGEVTFFFRFSLLFHGISKTAKFPLPTSLNLRKCRHRLQKRCVYNTMSILTRIHRSTEPRGPLPAPLPALSVVEYSLWHLRILTESMPTAGDQSVALTCGLNWKSGNPGLAKGAGSSTDGLKTFFMCYILISEKCIKNMFVKQRDI